MANTKDSNFVLPTKIIDLPRRQQSTRIKASLVEVKQEPEVNDNYIWKPIEKKALLEAIKKHGCSDPKKLATAVRTKSVNEIKVYLRRNMDRVRNAHFKNIAKFAAERESNELGASSSNEDNKRYNLLSALPPIDLWKRIISGLIQPKNKNPDYSLVLAELWKKFGEEEEELDIPNAPNFKAIYKFVEDTLMGTLPASLSPVDTCVMEHLLQEIYKFSSQQNDIKKFIKEFEDPVSIVPSSVANQQKGGSENPSETVSKEVQDDAAEWKKNLKVTVRDHIYQDYHRHQKVKENLNPMGIYPWLLHKTAEAISEFIEKPAR